MWGVEIKLTRGLEREVRWALKFSLGNMDKAAVLIIWHLWKPCKRSEPRGLHMLVWELTYCCVWKQGKECGEGCRVIRKQMMCWKGHSLHRTLRMLLLLWSRQRPSEEALVEQVSVKIMGTEAQFCHLEALIPWAQHCLLILVFYGFICRNDWQVGSFFVELYNDDWMEKDILIHCWLAFERLALPVC